LWKTRFDSDPRVVGRVVKLGSVTATVVGVMPEGFGFPTVSASGRRFSTDIYVVDSPDWKPVQSAR
jgi:hypothetical protein